MLQNIDYRNIDYRNIDYRNIKNINIIVAFCKTRGIGINNSLPWKIRSDMLKFKQLTIGNGNNAVIMGKNTWNSIPNKPLIKRDNLILSNSLSFDYTIYDKELNKDYRHKTFTNIDTIIDYCVSASYETIWIIGGDSIYSSFLKNNLVDKLYVTYLDYEFLCDTFFPEIDFEKYMYVEQTLHDNGYDLSNNIFNIYDRVYKKIDNQNDTSK